MPTKRAPGVTGGPDPANEVDFIKGGGHPTPEPEFIGEDEDTGVGAPPA